MTDFLDTDIKYLKGVGVERAKMLSSEIGVATFRDLLYYFPFRHIDRSRFYTISELSGAELPSLRIKGSFISFNVEGKGQEKDSSAFSATAKDDGVRLVFKASVFLHGL